MLHGNRSKITILLIGDLILFYTGLFLTLSLRYMTLPSISLLRMHFFPFSIIHIVWIIIFYIIGLYDINKKVFVAFSSIIRSIIATGITTLLFFYFTPYFKIAPKINLVADILIIHFLIWGWRLLFFEFLTKSTKFKIYLLGDSKEISELENYINNKPHLGYEITSDITSADIIVVSEEIKQESKWLNTLYDMVMSGKTIINFDRFYESVTGKIPISLISQAWFLENLLEINKQAFEKFKRWFDVVFSIILLIPFFILYPFIALLIKFNKGPVFIKQKRVGKSGKVFEIIKFRSMYALSPDGSAETNGAQWAEKKDKRITFIGNILRKTRIDELPQLWNVLKGDLSFIGPRPERPEFIKELTEKIPHYSMRHLVKPGLSGWAQINFPYGASVEDTTEKLQYDLYYVKNRSLALELSIFLKTIMIVFQRSGR